MFDWRLYQNEQLIEEYLDKNILNNMYIVNETLSYSSDDKLLTKKTDEYILLIDLANGKISINIEKDQLNGDIDLYKYRVVDTDDKIELSYQVSEEEPLNKIIISRRNQ